MPKCYKHRQVLRPHCHGAFGICILFGGFKGDLNIHVIHVRNMRMGQTLCLKYYESKRSGLCIPVCVLTPEQKNHGRAPGRSFQS